MSELMYFWNSPQKLIFDLGNLIDSTYTGAFNTTLTAAFFTSQETVEPAALIIPTSARNGAASSWYVTGKIFVWLDQDSESVTTGWAPTLFLPIPEISVSQSLTRTPPAPTRPLATQQT
jgi:hypothetical protein